MSEVKAIQSYAVIIQNILGYDVHEWEAFVEEQTVTWADYNGESDVYEDMGDVDPMFKDFIRTEIGVICMDVGFRWDLTFEGIKELHEAEVYAVIEDFEEEVEKMIDKAYPPTFLMVLLDKKKDYLPSIKTVSKWAEQ